MGPIYELSPEPPAPRLPGSVVVREGVDEVVDALAADLLAHSQNCVRQFGDFHMALSGGRTPVPLYTRLMIDPALREFPWRRVQLYLVEGWAGPPGDGRPTPDEERSAERTVRELLVDHSDIPPDQVHAVEPAGPEAGVRYLRRLTERLEWREKGHDRLDFVLLGLGADGSVAGLAPGSGAAADRSSLVVQDGARVSLGLRLINASRFVAVMVTGAEKRRAVEGLAGGRLASAPAAGVRPIAGVLRWYLDRAAAGG